VTAVEAATRKVRPAARADAPAFTASINRTRRSSEYGPGIARPPTICDATALSGVSHDL